mgnify:CR=1 FL=1
MDALIFELLTEKFGEEWYLELAKKGAKFSYASKKHGNQKWAERLAEKLLDKKDEYELIGIFSEGETASGPILEGVVYHCTEWYVKKSPYMYFEKKVACKDHLRSKKPEEYIEG